MHTPENISELSDREIFVFGSNLDGIHRRGSARTAIDLFGAKFGKGVGRQGQSYAIPTMGSLEQVGFYVDDLIEYAGDHPELTFMVTKIGVGIAGFSVPAIRGVFADRQPLPSNMMLPVEFS